MAPTSDSDRVTVPDPAVMRRAAWRTLRAGIVVVGLLTGFTAGGIAMLAAGEGTPAVPFAVGAPIAQLAVLVVVVAIFRVRATISGDTVSRRALATASTTFAAVRVSLLGVLVCLAVYTLVRGIQGDPWTLLTAAIIGLVLWLVARGAGRLRTGIDTTRTSRDPG